MNLQTTSNVGDFTGSTLVADPETGFLGTSEEPRVNNASGFGPRSVFTVAKKLQALNLLRDLWPDIPKVCDKIGIGRFTWRNHMNVDQSFRECVEDIQERVIGQIESVRMKVAQTPSGSFDRMCVMNAFRRELYNPKQTIEIEHKLTSTEARAHLDSMSQAVDAEVVETVKKYKSDQRKLNRLANPNGMKNPRD